jgi:hypothetical protein
LLIEFQWGQKPGWEKTWFRPPETRLGKNLVSTARNPVGKKPGFDRQKPGWQKTWFLD